MITTLVTVTILSAALAGSSQFPAPRLSPEACDAWGRLLSLSSAVPPDRIPHWLPEEIRAALAAACEPWSSLSPNADGGRSTSSRGSFPAPAPALVLAPVGEWLPKPSKADDEWAFDSFGPETGGPVEPSGTSEVWGDSSSSAERRGPRAISGPESSRAGAKRSQRPSEGRKAPSGRGAVSSQGKASPGGRAVSSPGKAFSGRRAAPSRGRAVASRGRALPVRGQIAATTALRQVGRPYVWGGGSSAGPTGGGFDCSGLALHAWAKAGARLTHYTGTQFRQGRRVPFSQLRPGDLVFFGGGTGDPTHVGVYVKDGVMVHAPKTGDVVRTIDFAASPYYLSRYRGAVRPTPR